MKISFVTLFFHHDWVVMRSSTVQTMVVDHIQVELVGYYTIVHHNNEGVVVLVDRYQLDHGGVMSVVMTHTVVVDMVEVDVETSGRQRPIPMMDIH